LRGFGHSHATCLPSGSVLSSHRLKAYGGIQKGFFMKEVLSQTETTTRLQQPNARWYQALTLAERLPLLQSNPSSNTTDNPANVERASQRFKQWKNQPPFQKSEQTFAQRLALDGLTEESLQALLAQPAEAIQASLSQQPPWLTEILTAYQEQDPSLLANLPLQTIDDPETDAIFQAIKPLLASGYARLKAGIAELQKNFSQVPFNPQVVGFLLFPRTLELLFTKLTRTIILELNIARVQGRLQGETPETRFINFLQQLSQPEATLALLEEYAVLARQLVEIIDRRIICSLELVERLCTDWDAICHTFALPTDLGRLTEIKEGAGDIHHGGRSVTILTWSSGLRLVYKPRSLAVDAHFQELLTWLNEQGVQPDFRTFKLLNKETHGWCEFIAPDECTSPEAIERFYQRLGGYLALLYTLEATDFHAENLIAAGEYPMLIDLESLLQPRLNPYPEMSNYGSEMISHSVLRSGLLPQRLWSNKDEAGIDLSGVAGTNNQLTPFLMPALKGQGTDEIHIGKERMEIKLGANQPVLQETEINILEYEQSLITGFTTVYHLLLQQREALLETIIPRFAHDETRFLLRPTQNYAMIGAEGSHPNVLRDGLERERLLDRLWIGLEYSPYMQQVLPAERTDLQNDDIPKFTTHPNSRDLVTSQGEIIPDFFQISGLELVTKGIQNLSTQDREKQSWIIQASFASLSLNAHTTRRSSLQLQPAQAQITSAALLTEAQAIGNRLHNLMLTQGDMVGWLGVHLAGGREWRPQLAELDLYSGLPGIGFFLAYLGLLTAEERYTTMAQQILHTLKKLVLDHKALWQWGCIGAFEGAGSLIYLLAHLGTIWQDPSLYQEAEGIVARLPELINADELFDVLNGSAGCLAALLSLYAVAPSETTLAAAVACGDHLLKHARPMAQGIGWSSDDTQVPLAGMGHGNAGIALNLLRLAAVSQEERFQQAALEAMAYERSLFSPERKNWPDLRDTSAENVQTRSQEARAYMMAWCHGAPGIGLARLGGLPYHDDLATRSEISAVIQALITEGFGRNHCLCHGDMGNLETLLVATRSQPDLCSNIQIEPLAASLLENMHLQGWQSGVPLEVETPGLMIGLAGTGYALLRLAAPERVPSLLLLAPPEAPALSKTK
jgi:type 2 lantibiotic biosynthesis protein LanM